MAAFIAVLKRFNIEHEVVTEQWPKVGTMDLTSHVAALKAAKPDLIFSSLLFADLPVFMKQAHAAGLTEGTKLVFPGGRLAAHADEEGVHAGRHAVRPQHALLRQSEELARRPRSSSLGMATSTRTTRSGKPTAPISRSSPTSRRSRKRRRRRAAWPSQDDVIQAMIGLEIESLGGKGGWRKDKIADQTFVQGFTTHKNNYDFVTLAEPVRHDVFGRPAEAARREFLGVDQDGASSRSDPAVFQMAAFANILLGGVFHAAVLFLVAAGLQLVFGVQKIVNLACGSFYALGAYFGVTLIALCDAAGACRRWLSAAGAARFGRSARLHRPADRAHAAHRL